MRACHSRCFRSSSLSVTTLLTFFLTVLFLGFSFGVQAQTAQAQPVVFLDFSWDSVQVHNRIAGFIVEHGYGMSVDYMFADTIPGMLALRRGDAQLSMEIWPDNIIEIWETALRRGEMVDLGLNFADAPQGWYVPTYMIEGDPERGIEPMAPDLRSVTDLPRYWELFRDPEVPSKGRFYTAPPGWAANDINREKLEAYGLLDTFVAFEPGSDSALVASMVSAYERGEPWVGYYWEPTWVMGIYDMTLLEEPPYSDACWEKDKACAYKNANVLVGAYKPFIDEHPELEAFLRQYETTLAQNNEFLAYMNREDATAEEAALYFLRTYEDTWRSWVPEEVAARVLDALAAY